jgi:hypothetical protein
MYTQTNDWTVTYKGQTRPLVREGVPQGQDKKFQTQTLGNEANVKRQPVSHKVTLTLTKANPDIENLRGLNLVAVKLTTVQFIVS